MLKLLIIAAIVACANGYYNHGSGHQSYYGGYGHAVGSGHIAAASIIPVNPHQGNLYNSGYGHLGGSASQSKIVEATYPGAVHKSASYSAANNAGYIGAEYAHGAVNHAAPATTYVHAPTAIAAPVATLPYNHAAPLAVAPSVSYSHGTAGGSYAHAPSVAYNHGTAGGSYVHAPSVSYNHGAAGGSYAHARYAVTEGPSYAHSRYAVNASPAPPSYGHARYAVPISHGIQKIGYNPVISHMGYENHGQSYAHEAAQSYSW